jgi:multidrug efflux pump subunit AcrB
MNLTSFAVQRPTLTWFTAGLLAVTGLAGYFALGQLEDPDFTVKSASVIATYPGAGPEEVEQEVTDRLEQAVQEMPELKHVSSISRAGLAIMRVDIRDNIHSSQMPQVWDVLRKKIRDATPSLPPGAGEPRVGDDFGNVYGFVLGVTGDGFDYAELEDYVKFLKKELSLVKGVARVETWGTQPRCIYVDVSESRLAALGLRPSTVTAALRRQNMVVDAGAVDIQSQRPRFEVTGVLRATSKISPWKHPQSIPCDKLRQNPARVN